MVKKLLSLLLLAVMCCVHAAMADTLPVSGPTPGNVPSGVHTHSWKKINEVAATCLQEGYYERICTICQEHSRVTVAAKGHRWIYDNSKGPTCKSSGVLIKTCGECKEKVTERKKPIPHTYGPWEVKQEATCTEKGVRIRYCTQCGLYWDEEIPAKEHNWVVASAAEGKLDTNNTSADEEQADKFCLECGAMQPFNLPVTIPTEIGLVLAEEYMVEQADAYVGAEYVIPCYVSRIGFNDVLVKQLTFADADVQETVALNPEIELRVMDEQVLVMYTGHVTQEDIDRSWVAYEVRAEGVIWDKAKKAWSEELVFSNVVDGQLPIWYGAKAALVLNVTQTGGPESFVPGAAATYEWTLTNAGANACEFDSIVVEWGPDALHLAGQSNVVKAEDVAKTKLGPKETLTGTCTLQMPSGSEYTDQAVIRWQAIGLVDPVNDPGHSLVSNLVMLSYDQTKTQPKLVLSMAQSEGPLTFERGEQVKYAWLLKNTGDADCTLTSLMVDAGPASDHMIASLLMVSGAALPDAVIPAQGSISGIGTLPLPDMEGFADVCCLQFTANGEDAEGNVISSNTLAFEYTTQAPEAPAAEPKPVLSMTKQTAQPQYQPGDMVTFDWNVVNVGGADCCLDRILVQWSTDGVGYSAGETFVKGDDLADASLAAMGSLSDAASILLPDLDNKKLYVRFTAVVKDDQTGTEYMSNACDFTFDIKKILASFSLIVEKSEKIPYPSTAPVHELPVLTKTVLTAPANGAYYAEGEAVRFQVTLLNSTDCDLTQVAVYDLLDLSKPYAASDELKAGEQLTFEYVHQVSAYDVASGELSNTALYSAVDPVSGDIAALSNTVTVPCGKDEPVVTVTKLEITTPVNGSYYTTGEHVTYEVTAQNDSTETVTDLSVLDCENNGAWILMTEAKELAPGEKVVSVYTVSVREEDAVRGYKTNKARADYIRADGTEETSESDLVISRCKMLKAATRSQESTACKRVLNADDLTYELTFCADHSQTAAAAQAAMAQGNAVAARQLWLDAVNARFEDMQAIAAPEAAAQMLQSQAAFCEMLSAHEALLRAAGFSDNDVARESCFLLENLCVDLCYEANTTAAEREDSYLRLNGSLIEAHNGACCTALLQETAAAVRYNEQLSPAHAQMLNSALGLVNAAADEQTRAAAWRGVSSMWRAELKQRINALYSAADTNLRKVVMNELTTFEHWTNCRSALLKQRYGEAAVSDELLAKCIMTRVMTLCTGK